MHRWYCITISFGGAADADNVGLLPPFGTSTGVDDDDGNEYGCDDG